MEPGLKSYFEDLLFSLNRMVCYTRRKGMRRGRLTIFAELYVDAIGARLLTLGAPEGSEISNRDESPISDQQYPGILLHARDAANLIERKLFEDKDLEEEVRTSLREQTIYLSIVLEAEIKKCLSIKSF